MVAFKQRSAENASFIRQIDFYPLLRALKGTVTSARSGMITFSFRLSSCLHSREDVIKLEILLVEITDTLVSRIVFFVREEIKRIPIADSKRISVA